MLSRSMTTSNSARAGSIRRMRRRTNATSATPGRLFCSTNGCPSFLEVDLDSGVATCQICGFTRRVS